MYSGGIDSALNYNGFEIDNKHDNKTILAL